MIWHMRSSHGSPKSVDYRIDYEHSYPYNLGYFQQEINIPCTCRLELLTLSTGESEFVA